MSDAKSREMLAEYFGALDRLKAGHPLRVPKGTRISKDAVALESGRGKGSIKKSRTVFTQLIQAIESAASEQENWSAEKVIKEKLLRAKEARDQHRAELDKALASLVSRIYEVHELKAQVRVLQGKVDTLMGLVPEHLLAKVSMLQ